MTNFLARYQGALIALTLLTACSDGVLQPRPGSDTPGVSRGAGFTDITITGLGAARPAASAQAVSVAGAARAERGGAAILARAVMCCGRTLTPIAEGDGTIQLDPVSVSTFTQGSRPPSGSGYRYVAATYRVRNATAGGTAYGDARTNLTFVAINTTTTLDGTALTRLNKFDGTPVTSFTALDVLPTGAASFDRETGQLTASQPDVLQAFTEAEAGTVGPITDVNSVLPYGFVVNNPVSGNRAIAASPAAGQFDGLVTFAFRVPLQENASDDAFSITARFLAVDDNETWVTRSVEEADSVSGGNMWYYSFDLGASTRSMLGASIFSNPATHRLCVLRTAGTSVAPTKWLINRGWETFARFPSLAGDLVQSGGYFSVSSCASMGSASETNLAIHSHQTGLKLGSHSVVGNTLTTIDPSLFAGDVVDVSLTPSLLDVDGRVLPNPAVFRFRVATAAGPGTLGAATTTSVSPNTVPKGVAVGDVDGDGLLDLLTVTNENIQVALGDGLGAFASGTAVAGSVFVSAIQLGDFNGDGDLDLAAVMSGNVAKIWLGDGAGAFTATGTTYPVPNQPEQLAAGDVNADGRLDLVVGSYNAGQMMDVWLGNGSGGFTHAPGSPFDPGDRVTSLSLGDLNRDGKLDVAYGKNAGGIGYRYGNGAGGFSGGSTLSIGSNPQGVVIADLNNDGLGDIAAASVDGFHTKVYLNNGSGGFTTTTYSASSDFVARIDAADMDGDGDLDLVVSAKGSTDAVYVRLNNGSGSFSAVAAYGVGDDPEALALGDLDGDGRVDVVTANRASDNISVLLGQPPEDGAPGYRPSMRNSQ